MISFVSIGNMQDSNKSHMQYLHLEASIFLILSKLLINRNYSALLAKTTQYRF